MVVAIKSADEEAVDNPREVGALAEGAVDAKSARAACAGRGVEGDKLVVAKPHREVCNHCFLLVQLGRKIPAARDKRIGFIWCSLPYGPQTRLTREHRDKEVTT